MTNELYGFELNRFDYAKQGKSSAADYRYSLMIYTFAVYYQEPIDELFEDLNTRKQC
jgi:hypothetical protein